jgi:hypothetical protein
MRIVSNKLYGFVKSDKRAEIMKRYMAEVEKSSVSL